MTAEYSKEIISDVYVSNDKKKEYSDNLVTYIESNANLPQKGEGVAKKEEKKKGMDSDANLTLLVIHSLVLSFLLIGMNHAKIISLTDDDAGITLCASLIVGCVELLCAYLYKLVRRLIEIICSSFKKHLAKHNH